MAGGQEKWYFTKEQLQISPSRKCNLDADKELAYRQQAANLIQDMGQRLQVSQLCINTAIVYMHRFYAFHSFTQFHRNAIAAAALFLAAKVEEQPRKLEYVIKVAHVCLHRGETVNALTTEQFTEQAQDLVFNENVLLQTLGFDVAIDHPHTHVVRTCHLVKASKDLAQTSYFMASNSLHLTTMCLQYKPTVVACFCIHLASKWSNWVIAQSHEGKPWFSYVDRTVTSDLLERLTAEFLHIFDKCPSRLKRKMMTMSNSGSSPHTSIPSQPGSSSNSSVGGSLAAVPSSHIDKKHLQPNMDEFDKSFDKEYERERRRLPISGGYVPATSSSLAAPPNPQQPQKIDFNMYKDRDKKERQEKEERERREDRERRQALQQQPRPGVPQPRASSSQPAQHQRPSTGQNHHKPHGWPHHKPPHHKVPHDYRHRPDHRPQIPPGSSSSAPIPPSHPPQSQPEIPPQRTRPPSLFSPENATTPSAAAAAAPRRSQHPLQKPHPPRPESRPNPPVPAASQFQMVHDQKPSSPHKKRSDATVALREMQAPAILSPFSSPPTTREIKEVKEIKEIKEKKEVKEFKEIKDQKQPRPRLHSNSEPELVPVVKKLDETPGYENVIRDSQRGNAIKAKLSEHKRPDLPQSRAMNGIETDPTLVSNLLKESLAKPVPITVPIERKSPLVEIKKEPPPEIAVLPPQIPVLPEPIPQIQPPQPRSEEIPEQKHKKEKKKKEKHKHKDRDKSKDDKKKHKKDRDKEKKKEPSPQPPPPEQPPSESLKITIPRDKLATSPGLKIKIPKERLAGNILPPQQASSLKIKISKELLETSRKRAGVPEPGPPQKIPRQNGAPHPKVVESSLGNGHSAK